MPNRTPPIKQFQPLFLLGLALLLLAACDRQARLSPLPPGSVVLAFGDSLTFGTGAGRAESYPAFLAGLLGRSVINAGVPGETSAEGLTRLADLLEEHRPDLVLLCHGGNDFLQRLDQERLRENLRSMVGLARDAGAQVLLVGVPQPGLFLSAAPLYAEVAEELGLPYEEKVLSEILADRALKSDTIHPNAAGYRRLADALARRIDISL